MAQLLSESREPLEEKFYDINITQDGPVAWVTFNFEFMEGSKVKNYGREVWQTIKTSDHKWKIFTVVWSSHHEHETGERRRSTGLRSEQDEDQRKHVADPAMNAGKLIQMSSESGAQYALGAG